jgi:hypothetical protein
MQAHVTMLKLSVGDCVCFDNVIGQTATINLLPDVLVRIRGKCAKHQCRILKQIPREHRLR